MAHRDGVGGDSPRQSAIHRGVDQILTSLGVERDDIDDDSPH
jgi:hypothetical protein